MKPSPPGLIIAAPASGSGKTTVTLGLIRAFRDRGVSIGSGKIGPDYIDPGFHRAAGFGRCPSLDLWGMRAESLRFSLDLAANPERSGERPALLIIEGVMGLFDGAKGSTASQESGSTADLAATTGAPVVLVLDAKGQSTSIAALVSGFQNYRDDVSIAGVILNRVGSARHDAMLRAAITALPNAPVILGSLPNDPELQTPSRHLGLVQAEERVALDTFLANAANVVTERIDLDQVMALARPLRMNVGADRPPLLPPLGQRIAVAKDRCFGFLYDGAMAAWRAAGAELSFFSPLQDEAPDLDTDAVFLPGGYPELHSGSLAASTRFLSGLREAASRGAFVYGECGGYMVLGEGITDKEGKQHAMAGLLPIGTDFSAPKRALGYRRIKALAETPLGPSGAVFSGHEFHYAVETENRTNKPLFQAETSDFQDLGALGAVQGSVAGSFMHLIDQQTVNEGA